MMEKQAKFLELVKYFEQLKEQTEKVRTELTEVMSQLGIGTIFQDIETKVVYQIVKPNGMFVFFKDIDYVRTKIGTERAGSLSVKKAEEAGFTF